MKHTVIYIPGLGDHAEGGAQAKVLRLWRIYGLGAVYVPMHWSDKNPYAGKYDNVLKEIDKQLAQGNRVSLIGVSAGASAAINAYAARQESIHKVVCVCGKLRNVQTISQTYYAKNPAFEESVKKLSASLSQLNGQKRNKILSLRPFADEIVPVGDTLIEGAHSGRLFSAGHALSIAFALTLGSGRISRFIKRK